MPGTRNRLAVKFSLRQRATEMGAFFREGKDAIAALYHHDRNAVGLGLVQNIFAQFRFVNDRNKLLRQFAGGVVDSDPLVVNQMTAEIGSGD